MSMNTNGIVIIRGRPYQHIRDDLYAPLSFHPVAGGLLRRLGRLVTYQQILDAVGDCDDECDIVDVKGAALLRLWELETGR